MRPKHLVAVLVLLALTLPASPAHAGRVVSVCDEAHLKSALSGGGTVTFTCSGTIPLTSTITISRNTTIDGSGQAVTISGNHAVRVFTVDSGVALNLNELTVAYGSADQFGGGIYTSSGTVAIGNSIFSGNSAGIYGGGIYNYAGTLTVSDSIFTSNSAIGGGGGGVFNGGTLTVSNSIFSGNSADWTGVGGGIYNDTGGTLTVSNSIFSGNNADLTGGGGIYNEGEAVVSNSTFSGNSATSGGGILNSFSGTATVNNSTFSGNSLTIYGGGVFNDGTLTVSNSTFSGNSAQFGGGVRNGGTLTVSNSTFSGNSASYLGGGVVNGGEMVVSNSTFSGNSATYGGGGSYNDTSGTLTLKNSIVANSPTGNNCYGNITDGGGNLSYPDTTCPGINANPLLGPLWYNGGPTMTMALFTGSAAVNAANDAICAAPPVNNLDQRGVTRPQGPHCDIGAYEGEVAPFSLTFTFLPIIMR